MTAIGRVFVASTDEDARPTSTPHALAELSRAYKGCETLRDAAAERTKPAIG
jgi:hypothetical protein